MGNARLVIWPGPWARIWLGKLPPGAEGRNWVEADRKLFGGLKFGVLNMLNISARNCNFTDSLIWKFLNSEKSKFASPGPIKELRLALPKRFIHVFGITAATLGAAGWHSDENEAGATGGVKQFNFT